MTSKPAIMVLEAYALGAIAAIRSLGSCGYCVHACSWQPAALGLKSNFATHSAVHPRYESPDFIPWFRSYVSEHDIKLVVPSEGFILGIRDQFDEFSHLLPLPNDADVVYKGFSKYDLFAGIEAATASGHKCDQHLPPYLLIDEGADAPSAEAITALGLPVFLKADGSHGKTTVHSETHQADSVEQALELLQQMRGRFHKIIIQGYVPGMGTGIYFLRWNGIILAEFANLCVHEVPHTGGLCSLRESWHHQEMRDDALRKLEAMQWQGVAMVEYRWDPASDKFALIEMNSRFWAALHLALYAKVDFPRLLAEAFFGEQNIEPQRNYQDKLCCRWTVPLEIGHVRSLMKDPRVPASRWIPALFRFVALSLNPRVRSDLYYPGDRALYFYEISRFIKDLFKRS